MGSFYLGLYPFRFSVNVVKKTTGPLKKSTGCILARSDFDPRINDKLASFTLKIVCHFFNPVEEINNFEPIRVHLDPFSIRSTFILIRVLYCEYPPIYRLFFRVFNPENRIEIYRIN